MGEGEQGPAPEVGGQEEDWPEGSIDPEVVAEAWAEVKDKAGAVIGRINLAATKLNLRGRVEQLEKDVAELKAAASTSTS